MATTKTPCGDCGATVGSFHEPGCDVERCPRCGCQQIGCNCVYEVCGLDVDSLEDDHPDVYENGPTDAMYAKWDAEWGHRRIPWTGDWPGLAECREYGFWATLVEGKGWVRCLPTDEGASEDINRLVMTCVWDADRVRWVRPGSKNNRGFAP